MSIVDATTPIFPPGRFTSHGQATTMVPRCGTHPTMACLGDPSRVTAWKSKPVHTMEIQSRVTQWRSKAGSHNGDPSWFTQWKSKPVHTMEIQSWFTQWRSKAGSHSGDPSRFTQWRSKASSHNGDPSRFTQWRSKPIHTMEIQGSIRHICSSSVGIDECYEPIFE